MSDDDRTPRPLPSEAVLGRHLRTLRRDLNLELETVAERSGLAAEVIEAVEQGRHRADVATLYALAEGLGMKPSAIVRLLEHQGHDPNPPE